MNPEYEFERFELDNGIPLYLNKGPFETVRVEAKVFYPEDKGVFSSNLLNLLLNDMNDDFSTKRDLTIALEEQYGADLITGVDNRGYTNISTVGVESIPYALIAGDDNPLLKGIDIFASSIKTQDFSQQYFDLEKNNLARALHSAGDDKDALAEQRTLEHLFGWDKLDLNQAMKDIKALKLDDIAKFHSDVFVAENIAIYACGDLDKKSLYSNLNNVLRDIPNGQRLERDMFIPDIKFECTENEVLDKENLEQAKMHVAFKVDGLKDMGFKERMALGILANIYSEELSNHVREEKNLVYTIYSYPYYSLGSVFVKCGFKIDNYESIKEGIDDVTERVLQKGKITSDMVKSAKDSKYNIVKGYWFDSQESRISLADIFSGRGDLDKMPHYLDRINEVTYDEVQDMRKSINLSSKVMYTLVPKGSNITVSPKMSAFDINPKRKDKGVIC